jgi:ribosomal protein S18 acetylase RimI-like enzyme
MEIENFNEQEKQPKETEILTGNELIDFIYQDNSLPQDKRFLSTKDGGVFEYFDPSDLNNNSEDKIYILTKNGKTVVGLGELEKSPYEEDTFWIKFISIDPEYRDRGFASALAEEMFKYAKQKNIALETSSFSADGLEKLKTKFENLAEQYEVKFKI